jgi:hypothetical protein
VHHLVTVGKLADDAAILERDAVGVFEIDRPRPSVVDDFCRLDTFGPQLVALFGQLSHRAGLESKMIKAGGNAEPAVDPCIVFCGYIGNSVRLQKGNKLTAADIEKHMPQVTAFFDRYRVGNNRLETQHALVKGAGLVEVECREADMRKSFVFHLSYSCSGF